MGDSTMGDSNIRSIMNLGNSIVGVSILAMPYCFSRCGMVLGALLLISCTVLTQWTCKMLMRAAVMTRNQTYENLALGVLGSMGKYLTGISVIGLNLGTCIAFFVIIGDLAPPIIAQATAVNWSPSFLRAVVLCLAALFVAFPLGLLRSVDSLSGISLCSLLFYMFLTIQLFLYCIQSISWGWWNRIILWDNSGLLKCIPIFALAFSCQTQLFIIYGALQDSSFRRISLVINGAIICVASLYSLVACFGYVSFHSVGVKGDVLSNFDVGFFPQLSRFGFSVSVMVSFPLMIFPCRVSINSLFFSSKSLELHVQEPIPQQRFVAITAFIIGSTLAVAILIPNVETVLSLTGATMGTLISFILPSVIFLRVAGWSADYSNRAKLCVVVGLSVMILSTTTIIQSEMNSEGLKDKIEQLQPATAPGTKGNGNAIVPGISKDIIKPGVISDRIVQPETKGDQIIKPGIKEVNKGDNIVNDKIVKPVVKNDQPINDPVDNGGPMPPPDKNIEQAVRKDKVAPDREDGKHQNGAGLPEDGEQKPQGQEGRDQEENHLGGKPPVLHVKANTAPAAVENPDKVGGKENSDANDAHNQIQNDVSKISARLNKLEEENKNLKQRQEAIEQIQVDDLIRDGVIAKNKEGELNIEGDLGVEGGNKLGGGADTGQEVVQPPEHQQENEGRGKLGVGGAGVGHEVQRRDAVAEEQQAVLPDLEKKDGSRKYKEDYHIPVRQVNTNTSNVIVTQSSQDSLHSVDGDPELISIDKLEKILNADDSNNKQGVKGGQRDLKTALAST